jgi:DNA-directed RNA polymerase specialized sigma24 family protein
LLTIFLPQRNPAPKALRSFRNRRLARSWLCRIIYGTFID